MKKMITFIFLTFIFFVLASESAAQFLLTDGKIPNDLEITVTTDGQKFGTNYIYRITSDGRVFSEDRSHKLAWGRLQILILEDPNNKENRRRQLPIKDRLSKDQLKQMIRGFENFGFLGMENSYPDQRDASCSGQGEIIRMSIMAAGWHKTVSVYNGCPNTDKSLLRGFWSIYDRIMIPLRGVRFIGTKKEAPNFVIN